MSKEEDNSAFPLHLHGDYGKGMTLRDYFAAAALQGFLAGRNINALDCSFYTCEKAAKSCYGYADAMIEARKGEA
jgi:hypothetical protein